MATPDHEEGQEEIPIVWVGIENVPVLTSNQALVQITGHDEFVLAFGHLTPPVLLGTEEQKREQLAMTNFVSIRPVARLGLTRQRIEELRAVLGNMLDNHDGMFP